MFTPTRRHLHRLLVPAQIVLLLGALVGPSVVLGSGTTATLTVVNDLHPSGDTGTFDLLVDGTVHAPTVVGGNTTGPITVEAGSHTGSALPSGATSSADYVYSTRCVEDPGDGTNLLSPVDNPGISGASIFNVQPGDQWTCTVTTTHKATLTVVKHVVNDNGGTAAAGQWTMTVTGTAVPGANPSNSTSFNGAESPGTTIPLRPGTYTVTEAGPSGYAPSSVGSCTGITVGPVDIDSCTFTNDDRAATIAVVNDLHPGSDPGRFDLLVDGIVHKTDAGAGGTTGPVTVEAGLHSATENQGTGTLLSDYVFSTRCVEDPGDGTNPLSPVSNPGISGVAISNVQPGDQWTCTITNTRTTATLTVVKHVVNDNGGTAAAGQWTMNITATNPSLSSFAGVESPGTTITINANAAYSVTESSGPSGYAATFSSGCSSATGLPPGASATCTVMNDDIAATLVIIKHVINDSGGTSAAGDFTLSVTGTAVPGPGASNATSFPGAESPGRTISLRPGTYSVSESGPSGYAPTTSGSCTTITVALGDTRTCVLTNDDQAPTAKIAFSTTRDGNVEIYKMNADGTGQTRLTTNGALDGEPAWSPDGTKIAFSSSRTGNGDIYRMNADGTGLVRLTTSTGIDLSPAWR